MTNENNIEQELKRTLEETWALMIVLALLQLDQENDDNETL